MSTLGLAATQTEYDAIRRPVASPCRASSRPWGLDMDTKACVRCGATFTRPIGEGQSQWTRRRYCSGLCYRSREGEPPAVRFWRYVAKAEGCWEWQAARNPAGYGSFGLDRDHMTAAHRFSWELHFGPIPPGLFVCHQCDNPPCVRPDHLFLGTPQANTRDMVRKERAGHSPRPGIANPNAKLTEAQVREIRRRHASGERPIDLAAAFGVSPPLISYIVKRKAWRHVD